MSRIHIPRPTFETVFIRKGHDSTERARPTCIRDYKGGSWKAVLLSDINGQAEVGPDAPRAGQYQDGDWYPEDWIWYPSACTYAPKGLIFVATTNSVVKPSEISPEMIPPPRKDEHYKTWEARIHGRVGEDEGMGKEFWEWSGAAEMQKKAWRLFRGTGEGEDDAKK